jgi:hypothetical protein
MIRFDAGARVSEPALWRVARQPLLVYATRSQPSPLFDTVALSRSFVTGITASVSGLYYPRPQVGVYAEISFAGLTTETRCDGVYFDPTLGDDNRALCSSIQGATQGLNAVSLGAGATSRAFPRAAVTPYLRAGLALLVYSASTTYLEGASFEGPQIVIADDAPRHTSGSYLLAVGLVTPLGADYMGHVEVADLTAGFDVVTGPADRLAHAPRRSRVVRSLSLSFGLDIVLGGKRGRRY